MFSSTAGGWRERKGRKEVRETENEGKERKEGRKCREVWKIEFITGEKYDSEFIARIFRQKMFPLSLKNCEKRLRNTIGMILCNKT